MFKKRNVKGITRSKLIRRESESESSEDEGVVIKKPKKQQASESDDIKNKDTQTISKEDIQLTKNDSAVKSDILNQEIIDNDRERKENDAVRDTTSKPQEQYATFIKPKSSMSMDKIGPKKAASKIKSTVVFDFQRDVCKDYRLTGFCGYGDSCKFLHARDDFKAGWKINNDWDLESKNKLEKELDGIPFKCVICKEDYKNPIKTSCGHYFCELCFLNRSKKTTICIICGKDTNGSALPGKDLKELLQRQKK